MNFAGNGIWALTAFVTAKGDAIGAVMNRPGYDVEDRSIPGDLEESFDKRFLLITPENLAEIAVEHQNLLYRRDSFR